MLDVGFNPENVVMPDAQGGNKEKKTFNDPRFFKAAIKSPKKKNDTRPSEYQALIRVLPRGRDFTKPFIVDVSRHYFFENDVACNIVCRKTINKDEYCPVCDDNWKNFNLARAAKNKALEIQFSNRRNKTEHICNILVVKDLVNPQNDGKVMLWKMPNTIYDMIVEAPKKDKKPKKKASAFDTSASEVVEPSFYPQDPVNGRDLELYVALDPKTQVTTYEASTWFNVNSPKAIGDSKEAIFKILDECNDLTEFTANIPTVEKAAKDFAAFQARLNTKLTQGAGLDTSANNSAFQQSAVAGFNTAPVIKQPEVGNPAELFKAQAPSAPAPVAAPSAPTQPALSMPSMDDDGDAAAEDDLPF